MVTVVFYEKPGCINNTRQKRLLAEAGHLVDARNLLAANWGIDELHSYFEGMPLSEWFNPSAPAIKNGDVVPTDLDEKQALALMQRDPLLIRRPLMQVGDTRRAGFDVDQVSNWIGLAVGVATAGADLEACARTDNHHCDISLDQPG